MVFIYLTREENIERIPIMSVTNTTSTTTTSQVYHDWQAHVQKNKDKYNAAMATSNILEKIDEQICSTSSFSKQLELTEEWDAYYSEFETQCQNYYDHSAEQFNFMEGQDLNNKEAYEAQLLKLGQGDVITIDTNKDGVVSQKEYVCLLYTSPSPRD